MDERYFITGGAGFVGSHTVDQLIRMGKEVTVFDIKPWTEAKNLHYQEKRCNYIEGDIRNFEKLEHAMNGHTHVLHLAAEVSVPLSVKDPIGTHHTNVDGTLNMFEASRKKDMKKVVYASSAAVYGEQTKLPIVESAVLKPLSPYGLHKVVNDYYAELYHKRYGLSVMGLRYFNIFGARQDPSSPYSGVVSIFVDRILKNQDVHINGTGDTTRDFVHIDNIVEANLKALDSDATGVCNIGTGVETSIKDLFDTICDFSKKQMKPRYEKAREGDIPRSLASIERAKSLIDYNVITSFEDGLSSLLSVK